MHIFYFSGIKKNYKKYNKLYPIRQVLDYCNVVRIQYDIYITLSIILLKFY